MEVVKVKGPVHSRISHEGPEGEWKYKSTLPLTSALDGCGWSVPRPGRFAPPPPPKDPVHVYEAGWAPGLVWMGAENLAPTGIQSPDHPARGMSLYQLSCHSPVWK